MTRYLKGQPEAISLKSIVFKDSSTFLLSDDLTIRHNHQSVPSVNNYNAVGKKKKKRRKKTPKRAKITRKRTEPRDYVPENPSELRVHDENKKQTDRQSLATGAWV